MVCLKPTPEQPAPTSVPKNTVHVRKNACRNQGGESIGNQVAAEQDGIPSREFTTGVPLGKDQESTGQESGLDESEEEPRRYHSREVGCDS